MGPSVRWICKREFKIQIENEQTIIWTLTMSFFSNGSVIYCIAFQLISDCIVRWNVYSSFWAMQILFVITYSLPSYYEGTVYHLMLKCDHTLISPFFNDLISVDALSSKKWRKNYILLFLNSNKAVHCDDCLAPCVPKPCIQLLIFSYLIAFAFQF